MKLKVKIDFSWAHRGIDVVNYTAGDEIETDDQDLINVAMKEGWVVKPRGGNGGGSGGSSDGGGADNGGEKGDPE